jgi:uncharacterized membrane protein
MDVYAVTKALHYAIGVIALAAFWSAAFTRKGSPLHKLVGRIYLLAMTGIIVTAGVITMLAAMRKPSPTVAFLGYLLVITATACWLSWRAIRDRRDFARYTGGVYRLLEVLNLASGIGVLALGLALGSVLFAGFSAVGIFTAYGMWRLRRRGPEQPLWWRWEHISAMLGNGVATHIAFLSIGLPKLFPNLAGPTLQNLAWFGPLLVAVLLGKWLKRKYLPAAAPKPAAVTA